jgi:hypothetical protein
MLYEIWPFDFGIEFILDAYGSVSSALSNNDEKISGKWDETFAGMAMVVLGERAQFRAEEKILQG